MERESSFFPKKEQPITDSEEFIKFLIIEIPKYTREKLDQPQEQGDNKTTLREFLENKTDGSEWTDPLGFTVKIKKGEYIIIKNIS